MVNDFTTEEMQNQIENLTTNDILLIVISCFLLMYIILTRTKRGRAVRKKFKILPSLIPIEDDYKTEVRTAEKVDGSSRQLKGEIIQNEHDILNELLGQNGTEQLADFDVTEALVFDEQDENIPLANQNLALNDEDTSYQFSDEEKCSNCDKSVEPEWKACPFCGEFIEYK